MLIAVCQGSFSSRVRSTGASPIGGNLRASASSEACPGGRQPLAHGETIREGEKEGDKEWKWPKSTSEWWISARQGGSWRAANQINPFLFSEVKAIRGLEGKMPYHVTRHGEELVYELHTNQTDSDCCLLHRVGFVGRVDRSVCARSGHYLAAEFSAQFWMAPFLQPAGRGPLWPDATVAPAGRQPAWPDSTVAFNPSGRHISDGAGRSDAVFGPE